MNRKYFDPGTIYDKSDLTLASMVKKQRELLGALAVACFTPNTHQPIINQTKEEYDAYTLEIDNYVKRKADSKASQ